MVFSSPIFLLGFLPILLGVYFFLPPRARNFVLLIGSLFFYSWGETYYVTVMLLSITMNYSFGIAIGNIHQEICEDKRRKVYLCLGLAANLALLVSFKYTNFIAENLNQVLQFFSFPPIVIEPIHLPVGISFFTFQAISYLVDVHRGHATAQTNPINLALYISLFPQLIAGPIVRYRSIEKQITVRTHSLAIFSSGVSRFIFGLSKKTLLANPLGSVADNIFSMGPTELTVPLTWIGAISYSLQIYFDFSGYSDMAIGLGRMFGFEFPENFRYPYCAMNLRDFWRRWHISLSTWFRDYVYIPLGGSHTTVARTLRNLLTVFVLTGLWHGASWNFLIWGLIHGCFLIIERTYVGSLIDRVWRPLQHLYVLLVVVIAWIFFRAETIASSLFYLKTFLGFGSWELSQFAIARFIPIEAIYAAGIGIILSAPIHPLITKYFKRFLSLKTSVFEIVIRIAKLVTLSILWILCLSKMASQTYDPFIYFRF